MKALVQKDYKRRQLHFLYYKDKILYKSIFFDLFLNNFIRKKAYFKLSLLPKNSSVCRIRYRCLMTGRARSVISQKNLGISRMTFRFLVTKRLVSFRNP
jgi:small subunit ribosomal protein S14